jgi:hypothetical protein
MARNLATPCFGREPKAKVATQCDVKHDGIKQKTFIMQKQTKEKIRYNGGKKNLFASCNTKQPLLWP